MAAFLERFVAAVTGAQALATGRELTANIPMTAATRFGLPFKGGHAKKRAAGRKSCRFGRIS